MEGSRGRILVIDDELGIREGCRRVLEPAGYTVETATTGQEGLQRLKGQAFDLVLLDVVMPDVRGVELLGPIYAHDPDIVCVIITGYATVELAVQAIKAGAYDFLSKPFTSDILLMTVRQGLERRQLSLEAQRLQALEQESAELAHAKKELERLDRFKTNFMLTVAHELRAPLTALQSFLNTIQEGYVPSDQQEVILERANERAQELLDMVDDLLRLAAVIKEEEIARPEPLSLADILEKIFPLLKAQADQKGIACAVEILHRPLVDADRDQMTQVWTNLISNAIKYTPPGGQVEVTSSEAIRTSRNRPGFDAGQADHTKTRRGDRGDIGVGKGQSLHFPIACANRRRDRHPQLISLYAVPTARPNQRQRSKSPQCCRPSLRALVGALLVHLRSQTCPYPPLTRPEASRQAGEHARTCR